MKKNSFLFSILLLTCFSVLAQPADIKTMQETARGFMRTGDYDNAIIVLTRALQQDKNNLELQKDLVMTYYLKRDYNKALEGVKIIVEDENADVVTFQIAGNVYKALEEVKECEKVYKKGLKKFPKSGPLYSEYGELLWSAKDFTAIDYWEAGIKQDPGYSGNYYNAANYYFYTTDKVWSLLYAEIFINMESLSERGAAMKQQLLQGYKEKLLTQTDFTKDIEGNRSEFAKAFLELTGKQTSLANMGVNVETLTMIRTRFILDWYTNWAARFPYRLFDYQRQLLTEGMFDAYNQWLFGPVNNLTAYDAWTKAHPEEYKEFSEFQKTRVFRMPMGQTYH